ncbi:hypothetical protein K440DRAFT_642168 [Wilcoxina mikolae CBS 423.85]|nr:hypothetical protein K440DRAFT_642168 [Wilcoxina mikolae CBS 423.85]
MEPSHNCRWEEQYLELSRAFKKHLDDLDETDYNLKQLKTENGNLKRQVRDLQQCLDDAANSSLRLRRVVQLKRDLQSKAAKTEMLKTRFNEVQKTFNLAVSILSDVL